jgi:hypothetical protein
VFLDLDETLVRAYDARRVPPELARADERSALVAHELRVGERATRPWTPPRSPPPPRSSPPLVSPPHRVGPPREEDEEDERDDKENRRPTNNSASNDSSRRESAPDPPSAFVVFERPSLDAFLDEVSAFAEIVVFTAGCAHYASPIIDAIDRRGRIDARLYRESCETFVMRSDRPGASSASAASSAAAKKRKSTLRGGKPLPPPSSPLDDRRAAANVPSAGTPIAAGPRPAPPPPETPPVSSALVFVKNLATHCRRLDRCVLVDNNPLSFLAQPRNGVPCADFGGDPGDDALTREIAPLLRRLALAAERGEDVRVALARRLAGFAETIEAARGAWVRSDEFAAEEARARAEGGRAFV